MLGVGKDFELPRYSSFQQAGLRACPYVYVRDIVQIDMLVRPAIGQHEFDTQLAEVPAQRSESRGKTCGGAVRRVSKYHDRDSCLRSIRDAGRQPSCELPSLQHLVRGRSDKIST